MNSHYSLYSEYGAIDSQVDPSEISSDPNRESVDLRDQARRLAEEVFASSSFDVSDSFLGPDTSFGSHREDGYNWGERMEDNSQRQEDEYDQEPRTQAPVRLGFGMGHIAAPMKMDYTETVTPNLTDEEYHPPQKQQGYGGPQQYHQGYDSSQQQGYGGAQQQQQQGYGGPPADRRQPQQHFDGRRQQNQMEDRGQPLVQGGNAGGLMTMMDEEDRFQGYPPPGELIPENEREIRLADNTGNRSNGRHPTAERSITPTSFNPQYPPPAAAEDLMAVIFSGYLFKQNRRGQFQKRLFRFDGLLLICLSPKKHRLPEHINLLTFDPARHSKTSVSNEFISALGRFYPTNPPMPALTNPLIASYSEGRSESSNPDVYTKYYHMPKWIIPTAAMQSIHSSPSKDPESKAARTFVIHTQNREYVLRAPTAAEFRRWSFLLSRMSAAGGDAPAPNRELGSIVRENDEDDDDARSDDEGETNEPMHHHDMVVDPRPPAVPVMDPTHPSLARMGAWQKSVADLLGRDQDAGGSLMSVSNSDGTTTIERGLGNRRSRQTNSTMSSGDGYRYPPGMAGAPPVPAIPQSLPPGTRPTRSDSLSGRGPPRPQPSSNAAASMPAQHPNNQRNYPTPVPLRPEQLQPPNGRVMKGPTIFGAAIAAGMHPTTPMMPPKDLNSRNTPSPSENERAEGWQQQQQQISGSSSSSSPLKKGASIRQMNRTVDRMSMISDGMVIQSAYLSKPPPTKHSVHQSHNPSPLGLNLNASASQETEDLNPIALDASSLEDLNRSCSSLLRVLRRIQGDDTDESSPDPRTRRNPILPVTSNQSTRSLPFPSPLIPPTREFIMRFAAISVPHFAGRISAHLSAAGRTGLLEKVERVAEEWRVGVLGRVERSVETGEARDIMVSRATLDLFGRFIDVVEEVRKKVIAGA
ncbi:hypothetical protein HDU67_006815 [Dinochytrium kinnereticum]|nr:hypothetical protein HDU67_006815 [Dinochytrium kinnereticum]